MDKHWYFKGFYMKLIITVLPLIFMSLSAWADDEPLSIEKALSLAFAENPEIAASQARADAESSLVRSKYWLPNPKVGLMRESNLNNMQLEMGPMTSWSVSQELMFPLKYFAMGGAQSARAEAAKQQALDKRLDVRQRLLTTYYGYYSSSRMLALLEAQRETLREIARIAEARRATGAVPQQDEMKAHVEQTRIENEILLQQQEVTEMKAKLLALLNWEVTQTFTLPKEDLATPKLSKSTQEIQSSALTNSKMIAREQAMLNEAENERRNAKYSYFPDFMVSYRKAFINSPNNAYAAGIEMTIPLWFFAKQTSEVSAASARALEAEKNLEATRRNVQAESQATASKVETYDKLLKIYETALIPQATSTLNSSRSAYTAGKVGFQELLDSERSLYSTRMSYYQTLAKFVESVTQLERITGTSISSLPFGDSL